MAVKGQGLIWGFSLAPLDSKTVTLGVTLGDAAGANEVSADLSFLSMGAWTPVASASVMLPVARTAPELLQEAQADLTALSLHGSDAAHRAKALKALAKLNGPGPTNRRDAEKKIEAVLDAIDEVTAIRSVDVTDIRLTLDALLRYWELKWTGVSP